MNKILIVDDERFEREQLCQIVEEAFPHEVQARTAENGRQAVETAALWTPGIVLMDVIRTVRRCIDQAETEEELKALAPMAETLSDSASYDKTTLLMANVKKYLQHNYMLYDVSLDSISDILNINASYFSMLFKKSFGANFVDYLTDLRISAAKELLADPFLAAAEIANMVGYESPNYFTRVFKKTTGMTPTEYRKLRSGTGKDGPV